MARYIYYAMNIHNTEVIGPGNTRSIWSQILPDEDGGKHTDIHNFFHNRCMHYRDHVFIRVRKGESKTEQEIWAELMSHVMRVKVWEHVNTIPKMFALPTNKLVQLLTILENDND